MKNWRFDGWLDVNSVLAAFKPAGKIAEECHRSGAIYYLVGHCPLTFSVSANLTLIRAVASINEKISDMSNAQV